MNRQLRDQWQVALIWMRDVNMAATERTPRGLIDRLASREIAEYHLNRYFEMVERVSQRIAASSARRLLGDRWQ
jgi:hypothetical protein